MARSAITNRIATRRHVAKIDTARAPTSAKVQDRAAADAVAQMNMEARKEATVRKANLVDHRVAKGTARKADTVAKAGKVH